MNPGELRARLRALPKVELHRHLEGALRLDSLWEFHQSAQASLHASREALEAALVIPAGEPPGFRAFLARFAALRFRYGTIADLERVGREAVADAAADGVVAYELRFAPLFWAWRARDMPPMDSLADLPLPPFEAVEAATEALLRGAFAEAARRGVLVSCTVALNRQVPAAANALQTKLLERPLGAKLAAVDVCGDEACPLEGVAEFIDAWRRAGRGITLHAGEDPGGPGAANVREALERFGAVRIGHGVRAAEDPAVVRLLKDRGATLEVCPTSNVQTGAAASFEAHPLKALHEAGVRVTVNSDDPTISAVDLTEEYARAHERCGVPLEALREMAIQAARASFFPEAERAELAKRIAAAWDAFLLEP